MTASWMHAGDLVAAADAAVSALGPSCSEPDRWEAPATGLEWDCRTTLDHAVAALLFLSGQLASQTPSRVPRVRSGDPAAAPEPVVGAVGTAARILATVVRGSPPDARAWHPAGMADPEGFVAMGCDEILVHTHDVASGLQVPFHPPDDLPDRVLRRLFPWTPEGVGGWEGLLWANGRIALDGHGRVGADWVWHCAPLDEWDGTVPRRPTT